MSLTQELVFKLSLAKMPDPDAPPAKWESCAKPNYLVYDDHKAAPPGFAVRVGKKGAVYLVEKLVAGKKLKIPVGLASGKKGDEKPMALAAAREKAWDLIQVAKKHGTSPKKVQQDIEASELTMGQIWDRYIHYLRNRAEAAKPNSLDSLAKARAKMADWEDRKVRLITAAEVIARFDLHAIDKKHKTAAEAMGRWATTAVGRAIDTEIHNAHAEGRPPSLTYNPFTILLSDGKYRTSKQLEREYAAKGIRNPLSFNTTVGPFVKAAWDYRAENPLAADFLLLTLLWGMRPGESCTFQWRDRLPDEPSGRWIDLDRGVAFVGDAKNRGDHEFPIAPCALTLLKRRRDAQIAGEPWVFPARSAKSEKGHYADHTVALGTVKKRAGIAVVRGHDLRRTFGAACEKLAFTDRQTKRMLGHAVAASESLGRYTTPEWIDLEDRMRRVEDLILSRAPAVYNALRPKAAARLPDSDDIVAAPVAKRVRKPSRRS